MAASQDGQPTRFFGGPPPSDAHLEAAGPGAIVRVRPDLLSFEDAKRLVGHGVAAIELDALTFDGATLRQTGRRYGADRIRAMVDGLRDLGSASNLELGIVLGVGLPGASREQAIADAHEVVGRFDTARLHPVLVFRETGLWRSFLDEFYTPLTLAQAVDACREMLDILEPDVKVIRVGQQPGPDELGRCVAGPFHSGFRELVESQRTLDTLRSLFRERGPRGSVVLRCATADETRTRGPLNDNLRALRAEFGLTELEIRADPALPRGDFILEAS